MKRYVYLGIAVVAAVSAIVLAERRKAQAEVGPTAVLYFIADTQRELARLPMRVTRLSDEEEVAIGNDIVRRWGLDAQASRSPMAQYVERVGLSVAGRAKRKLPYKIHYLEDDGMVNAFALPGGHVFIGSGLVKLMDSEDQLAAVLGHEIEHIDHYHCAERYQVEAQMRKLKLGSVAAVARIPLSVYQAGYSKDQELESDSEGTKLAVLAGYSPLGAVRLFEIFEKFRRQPNAAAATPQEEAVRVAIGSLAGYFRSHPYPAERAERIRRMIASEGWEAKVQERPLAMGGVNAAAPAGAPPMIGTP